MEIKYFSDLTEEQVKFIAETNYNYWKKFNPILDYNESTDAIIAMRANVGVLPIGLALVDGDNIIGFCTLRVDRLKNHLDKNPWLCNVMIFDKYQGKGYAAQMLESACLKFKDLVYKKLYAWTYQVPDFYKKLGWKYEGKITKNEGGEGLLFSHEI
jgi:GNAT superfamily N-acetyltransferase